MEIGLIVGLVAGMAFVFISILLAGDMQITAVLSFIDPPSFMITVGGAMASVIGSFPMPTFVNGLKSISKVLKPDTYDPIQAIKNIIELANVARKEGLLALDDKSASMDDDFLRRGIMLVVDGTDQELVRNVLETEIGVARKEGLLALDDKSASMDDDFLRRGIMLVVDGTDQELVRNVLETEIGFIEERHKMNMEIWSTMASQFPAWGMIGTLVGLVIMLQNLDDPTTIGPKMAVALITTFYGSLFANWLSTPVANKMKIYSGQEMIVKEITVEGILSIAAGENPRIIEEKLKVFISPNARVGIGEGESAS